jgi:transcription termination factor Rho
MDTTMNRSALEGKLLPELQQIAQALGVEGVQRLRKAGLIDAIVERGGGDTAAVGNGETTPRSRSRGTDRDAEGGVATAEAPESPVQVADAPEPSPEGGGDGGREGSDRGGGEGGGGDRGPSDRGARGPSDRGDRGMDRGGDRGDREGGRFDDGPGGRRRRPSREDRRRARDERRAREEAERLELMKTAPSRSGILDLLPDGYGFLRTSGYLPGNDDVYVSLSTVRKHQLRKGDVITGKVRQPQNNEKYAALLDIETVNDQDVDTARERKSFDKLTPLFPDERFLLENGPLAVSERIIDMIAPVGKGQRGMVVSPPKAGKTTILKQIANGIVHSDPDTHLIVLLVDERPEEVTDWQRTVTAAEVVYSTFDKPTDQHIQVTELVLERAKRLAEAGQDVAIILDSLTRLARAYNLSMPASGKILTGGIDSAALYPPRRFFGAARNIEEGGSVTIIASALVETGSRMDEGIFEEFKGTGNMEIRLDRNLSEKRLFPAINVDASSTRKEELLLPPEELALVIKLRRVLHALEPAAALELLVDKIRATKSNEQFLKEIAKAPSGG